MFSENFTVIKLKLKTFDFRENRITHVLSHHLHTNTVDDLEISMVEPMLNYLPTKTNNLKRYGQLFIAPVLWLFFFHVNMNAR